ncbi:MAG: GH116 family glycosyl hydrolase, partial [bacterium]
SIDQTKENILAELWNGRCFKDFFDPWPPVNPESNSIQADQLLGEWYARLLGLENPLPPGYVQTALGTLLDNCITFSDNISDPAISTCGDTRSMVCLAGLAAYEGRSADGLSLLYDLHRRATASGAGLTLPASVGSATGTLDELAGPASWAFLIALEGLHYNARLQRLTLSPHFPENWENVHVPVFAPTFSGWMDYRPSTSENSRRITFQLEQIADGRSLEISQVATEVPPAFREQSPVLLLEGFPSDVGVQQTSLELLALVLDKPLKLRPGDSFTLVLATDRTGRIDVGVAAREIVPRGPSCKIDILPDSHFAFTVTNRLRQSQILNLRFRGLREKSYRIAVDGREGMPIEKEGVVMTLPLPGGAFTELQEQRAGWLTQRVPRLAQVLSENPSETRALRELWKLREAVEKFAQAVIGGRTVTVDLYEPEGKPPERKPEKTLSAGEAERIVSDLESAAEKFQSQITKEVTDRTLAARLLGLALPIDLDFQIQGDPGKEPGFDLIATVNNPNRLPFTGRLIVTAPKEDWRVLEEGSVTFDPGRTIPVTASRHFEVRMPGPAIDERVEMTAVLIGEVDGQSFILESQIPVGRGFLRDWMLLGPLPNRNGQDSAEILHTGQEVDLEALHKGLDGDIRWWPHYSGTAYVDLLRAFDVKGPATAFAHLYVYSQHDRPALIHLGAGEGVRVVLNRREVLVRSSPKAAQPEQYVVPVGLDSGWNSLLLEVSRFRGDWGFYLEITDSQNRPISDLKVSLRR